METDVNFLRMLSLKTVSYLFSPGIVISRAIFGWLNRPVPTWFALLLEFLENSWNFVIFCHDPGKLAEKHLFSLYSLNSSGQFVGNNYVQITGASDLRDCF